MSPGAGTKGTSPSAGPATSMFYLLTSTETSLVEHKSAKTPLSEQGDVKEEGSVLRTRPTIERQIAA